MNQGGNRRRVPISHGPFYMENTRTEFKSPDVGVSSCSKLAHSESWGVASLEMFNWPLWGKCKYHMCSNKLPAIQTMFLGKWAVWSWMCRSTPMSTVVCVLHVMPYFTLLWHSSCLWAVIFSLSTATLNNPVCLLFHVRHFSVLSFVNLHLVTLFHHTWMLHSTSKTIIRLNRTAPSRPCNQSVILLCLLPASCQFLEDGGDMFLQNISWLSTDYTVLYPRRRYSSKFYTSYISRKVQCTCKRQGISGTWKKMEEVWKLGEGRAYWHVTHLPSALSPRDIIFPEDDYIYF
jgi:hypothetical protein